MDKSNWEKITILSEGDEDYDPSHPLADWEELKDMKIELERLEEVYKENYDELRIIYRWTSTGFGGMRKWYELQGRYTDPKKIILYGSKV